MNDLNYINEFCQHGLMLTMHNSDFQQKERILRLPRAVIKWINILSVSLLTH